MKVINVENNIYNIFSFVFIIFLALYLVDFLGNIGYYTFVFISSVSLFLILFKKINKIVYLNLLILIGFSLSVTFIMLENHYISSGLIPAYILLPSTSLFVGFLMGEKDNSDEMIKRILYFFMCSLTIYVLLSYLKTLSFFGTLDNASRKLEARSLGSFWNVNNRIKATVMTLKLVFGLSLIPMILIQDPSRKKKQILIKIMIIISFVISLGISLQMGSRTSIIVSISAFLMFYIVLEKLSVKKFLNLTSGLLLASLAYVLFKINFLNLSDWWQNTSTYNRFKSTGLESGRTDAWKEVTNHFFDFALGGKKIPISLDYAHNLWLDILYETGWITTLLLLFFTLINIYILFIFLNSNYDKVLKSILLLSFLGLYLFFMSEPILSGNERNFFVLYCFLHGIVLGLNHKSKRNVKEIKYIVKENHKIYNE